MYTCVFLLLLLLQSWNQCWQWKLVAGIKQFAFLGEHLQRLHASRFTWGGARCSHCGPRWLWLHSDRDFVAWWTWIHLQSWFTLQVGRSHELFHSWSMPFIGWQTEGVWNCRIYWYFDVESAENFQLHSFIRANSCSLINVWFALFSAFLYPSLSRWQTRWRCHDGEWESHRDRLRVEHQLLDPDSCWLSDCILDHSRWDIDKVRACNDNVFSLPITVSRICHPL